MSKSAQKFSFQIEKRIPNSLARVGVIHTPHGDIATPAFIVVGTKATVKGLTPEEVRALGAQAVLSNTYHLYLKPGDELVRDAGGLHKFMSWDGPTFTDSGGFQVFSLGAAYGIGVTKIATDQEVNMPKKARNEGKQDPDEDAVTEHEQLAKVDDDGVTFKSHIDGSTHRFTPERSIQIQHNIGADIIVAFDECTSPTAPYEYQKEAMYRTHEWAKRSLRTHRQNVRANQTQSLFGIVQGGRHEDLRKESAQAIGAMDFDGFGIGGSFSKEDMQGALQAALPELPEEKPRHFLGIGEPGDILTGIAQGMDLFDCVAATRIGRHGSIYTRQGIIHLKGEKYKDDYGPLDPQTIIVGTEGFTRAYVAHQLRAGEMLGSIVCSLHNLGFIIRLVDEARNALLEDTFDSFRAEFMSSYYGSL